MATPDRKCCQWRAGGEYQNRSSPIQFVTKFNGLTVVDGVFDAFIGPPQALLHDDLQEPEQTQRPSTNRADDRISAANKSACSWRLSGVMCSVSCLIQAPVKVVVAGVLPMGHGCEARYRHGTKCDGDPNSRCVRYRGSINTGYQNGDQKCSHNQAPACCNVASSFC